MVKRIGEKHAHTLKVKARVRAKGQRGTGYYNQTMVNYLRKKSRTQMLWTLTLSGDWHIDYETEAVPDLHARHMMRCMMTANVAVDQRFANGTQAPRCRILGGCPNLRATRQTTK